MAQILVLLFTLISVAASQDPYNYFKKGNDWTGLCANKTSPFQTPINLETSIYLKESFDDMQLIMMQESFS